MKLISFKGPRKQIEALDELVRLGIYASRSEAIRVAIRDLIRAETHTDEYSQIDTISPILDESTEKLTQET